jgi:ribonuclease HI
MSERDVVVRTDSEAGVQGVQGQWKVERMTPDLFELKETFPAGYLFA